jgi:hypothetical protein
VLPGSVLSRFKPNKHIFEMVHTYSNFSKL